MADGVSVPENMQRCMCNNFSLTGFWRGWHSSFNRWLVRYLCPAAESLRHVVFRVCQDQATSPVQDSRHFREHRTSHAVASPLPRGIAVIAFKEPAGNGSLRK